VERMEAGERAMSIFGAALEQDLDLGPDAGRGACDVGSPPAWPSSPFDPTGAGNRERKTQGDGHEAKPEPPIDLARPLVCAIGCHLKEVEPEENDHRLRAEMMQPAHEPPRAPRSDVMHASPRRSARSARSSS